MMTERERLQLRIAAERRAYLQALDANHQDELEYHEALIDDYLDALLHLELTEPKATA